MSNAVTKVWDIGGTVFKTAAEFENLLAAVTAENVQPQAVRAAEALGSGLLVRPELIDRAITVLNGNENVKWKDLKVSVGIHSGDLHRTIRNSTGLLSFFLLCCALKPFYVTSEIGPLAQRMLISSGIFKRYPVSSSQLTDLVDSFAGHCEKLNSAQMLHTLADDVDQHAKFTGEFYCRPSPGTVADIAVNVFEMLGHEDVKHTTLCGSYGGILIATLFSWLVPGTVSLSIDGQSISLTKVDDLKGNTSSKISKLAIDLSVSSHQTQPVDEKSWVIRNWKDAHPTDFVVEPKKSGYKIVPPFLPRNMTRVHLNKNSFRSDVTTVAIGQLSGALIILISTSGRLNTEKFPGQVSKHVLIREFLPDRWLEDCKSAITLYGWPDTVMTAQFEALEMFKAALSSNKGSVMDRLFQTAKTFTENRHPFIFRKHQLYGRHFEQVMHLCMNIAANAIGIAMCEYSSGIPRIPGSSLKFGSMSDVPVVIDLLSSEGLELTDFREFVLRHALPDLYRVDLDSAVAYSNGHVAGMAMLWDFKLQKRHALSVRVGLGNIKCDGFSYNCIRERIQFNCDDRALEETVVPILGDDGNIQGHPDGFEKDLQLRHVVAESGRSLEFASYFQNGDTRFRNVSWKDSLNVLACVMEPAQILTLGNLKVQDAVQRHKKHLDKSLWASFFGNKVLNYETKLIYKTFGMEELRFFGGGLLVELAKGQKKTVQVLLRDPSYSLALTLLGIPDIAGTWVIIY